MDSLRLDGVDENDLAIISSHCQDAIVRAEDIQFRESEGLFVMAMNRFVWEKAQERFRLTVFRRPEYERRRAVLHFDRVLGVKRNGVDPRATDQVLSLLTIRFSPGEAPSGWIELVFAGGSAIRLDVECIEARLTDLDAAWSTSVRPDHEADAD
ncbi:hypothetical protein ASG43_20070 [Aureimonas sp. Leaf454]|uniref:DUF2948 family protein n=1 Tax=Aureimonas sp. Leaf454 TaxID=1736381 RepID=UPI0006F76F1F|nr:DUF2948 family protein [Aureimonas sp. Leaf454]KQT52354.1 hypothetical protein ASG43_20070 [Aureimonas sp. Leaf454]